MSLSFKFHLVTMKLMCEMQKIKNEKLNSYYFQYMTIYDNIVMQWIHHNRKTWNKMIE